MGFPGVSGGKKKKKKKSSCNVGDVGSIPGKIPWKRAWQPTLVFFPGEFHGQRSPVGYSHGAAKSQTQLNDFCFQSFM